MGFLEEIVKAKLRHGGKHRQSTHHGDDHRYRPPHASYEHQSHGPRPLDSLLSSLPHKKSLLKLALFGCLGVVVIGIVALLLLLPVVASAIEYIGRNGVQGLVQSVLLFLQQVWKGNG